MIGTLVDMLGHYYHVGDFARMGSVARTAMALLPGDGVSMQLLGLAYLRMGQARVAEEVFAVAAGATEGSEIRPQAVMAAASRGQPVPATSLFQVEACLTDPKLAPAWEEIGHAWNRLGYRRQAETAFRSARDSGRRAVVLQCGPDDLPAASVRESPCDPDSIDSHNPKGETA